MTAHLGFRRGKMDEQHFHKFAITVITALLLAAIGQGLILWRDNSVLSVGMEELRHAVDANTDTIRALAQQAHANSIHRIEHEKQAERWINQIIENGRAIHDLQQQPGARPDPFTGSQGRELQRQIDELKKR